MAKKDKIIQNEEADVEVNESGLQSVSGPNADDEALKKYQSNYFKLSLLRIAISVKNHVSKLVLLMVVASMIFLTCTEFIVIRAHGIMTAPTTFGPYNAMLYFFSTLLAILSVVAYMNATGRHVTVKKKAIMLSVFFVFMLLQILFDVFFVIDCDAQIAAGIVDSVQSGFTGTPIATSKLYITVHIILSGITVLMAALEPVVQPFTRKIHFN